MSTEKSSRPSINKDKKSRRKSAAEPIKVDAPIESKVGAAESKKKGKAKEVEKSPETAPKATTDAKKQKKGDNATPKSISATSKASAPVKVAKSSEKPTKKTKAKEPSPSPQPAPEAEDAEDIEADGSEDEEGENDYLHGFSTDDDDSSDEEDATGDEPSPFDISKLPTIAKDDATVKRKLEKAKRQPTEERGVVYLGRVPHGFYEDQMRGYFSQFGNVTRVRLSRNKKTGKSKHYGFVEFDSSSVAQIVAETMDNYLLTGHILRCKVIPKDEVHPELWIGANRKWRAVPQDRLARVKHNKLRTEEEQTRAAKRLIKRQNLRKRKLADAGIKYDFEAVSYKKVKEVKA